MARKIKRSDGKTKAVKKRTTKRVFEKGKETVFLSASKRDIKTKAEEALTRKPAAQSAPAREPAAKTAPVREPAAKPVPVMQKPVAPAPRKKNRPLAPAAEKKAMLRHDPFSMRSTGPAARTDTYASTLTDIAGRIGVLDDVMQAGAEAAPRVCQTGVMVDNYDLPHAYNKTDLRLMVRDTHWIFAYWEIARDTLDRARNEMGDQFDRSRIMLRVYEVSLVDFNGSNANYHFDFEVGLHANNWYINMWNDNASCCAELGLLTPEGHFHPLTRSNFVRTPRISRSDRYDVIWMEVKEDSAARPFISPRPAMRGDARVYTQRSGRRVYLSYSDLIAYYSRFFSLKEGALFYNLLRRHGIRKTERYLSPEGFCGPDVKYDLLPDGSARRTVFAGASEMLEETTGAGRQEERPAASEALVKPGKARGFFFEVGTELIVYGRTEPDAEVTLGGKKVHLREDGTFTLRFSLSDGTIPLDLRARSRDGSMGKEISLAVERRTERSDSGVGSEYRPAGRGGGDA